jgi:ABC-type transport system involved in multi-copper enzyme maturation permease subunit
MSTSTVRPRTGPAPSGSDVRVTQRRVLAAEALKLRTSRSVVWLLVASASSILAAGVAPALGLLLADATAEQGGVDASDPTGGALSGISFTQLLIAVVGVLVVSSEYTTGLFRATFSAVPRRLPVLWAKAVLAAAVVVGVALASVLIAFFTAQAVLAAADVPISLGEPGVLRALVGSALYLGVTAALGVAVGSLLRSALGGIAGVFVLLFVVPVAGMLVPAIGPYLPSNAGASIMRTGSAAGALSPWVGLGVFVLYAVVALAGAAYALARRDA